MKNLNDIFNNAKNKKVFINNCEIEQLINDILQIDKTIFLDWDKDAGEEWIRLYRQDGGLICMLHVKIGLAFARLHESDKAIKDMLYSIYVVDVEDYNKEEWYINLDKLCELTPEMTWSASKYSVDTASMSLNDLYFATV